MQSEPSWGQYEDRFIRVLSYIHAHLDDHLDMAAVAEIACLSPYHWHRIYVALMGGEHCRYCETVAPAPCGG